MRSPRFNFDQAAASFHNSRTVITLAKFLHTGPSSGSVEFEYLQYTVSRFLWRSIVDAEKLTRMLRILYTRIAPRCTVSHE